MEGLEAYCHVVPSLQDVRSKLHNVFTMASKSLWLNDSAEADTITRNAIKWSNNRFSFKNIPPVSNATGFIVHTAVPGNSYAQTCETRGSD